ncbi:hypothetical protein [Roseisolibacter sp. H3M3-2]|uniref:hypothetical protein n=1 Tax=Roseisolibacter sp. H3M3-2 TaxID=3031323 RepID=UPI0023DCCB0E|nr:hypothetical protein [Roseisolibacter sp. H3M3-2]MDF1506045.1 hypothetical protein [Roseisolibacter sp. H3M3-2]
MRRAPVSLLTAALLLAAPAAHAAAQAPASPVAARSAPRRAVGGFVMQGIELTPGQEVLVRAINRRFADERAAITKGDPKRATQPAVREELFRSIDRMMAEERELLTAAQRERFDRNVDRIHASWERVRRR